MRGGEGTGKVGSDWSHCWKGLTRSTFEERSIARGASAKGRLPLMVVDFEFDER